MEFYPFYPVRHSFIPLVVFQLTELLGGIALILALIAATLQFLVVLLLLLRLLLLGVLLLPLFSSVLLVLLLLRLLRLIHERAFACNVRIEAFNPF